MGADGQGASTILNKVCRAVGVLAEAANEFDGLFPSILDLDTGRVPDALPPKIAGQRNEDRSYPGTNLMHDKYVLDTIYGLGGALNRPDYREAADSYLRRFAVHCTNTVTGLFPWGEHAFWNVAADEVGNSFPLAYDWWTAPALHDHLSAAPFWLWEKLWEYNPRCVERFAEGLDYHWRDGEPAEYCRHANIEIKERPPREARSCDFPRHGGHYIMDWSFAYLKTGRADFRAQIDRMLDFWWEKRNPATGMLPLESKTPKSITAIYGLNSPGQAMSLGMSLLETAELLDEKHPDLAAKMRERGTVYVTSFLTLPHDLDNDVWVSCTRADTDEIISTMGCWGSVYGGGTAAGVGEACLGYYLKTHDERFLRFSECVGKRYLTETLPEDAVVPVVDAGASISLLAHFYDITGERKWLEGGLALAERLMPAFLDHDLPRGEASIDYYDSQMGPGSLLRALAWIALLAEGREDCPLGPDYSGR